MSEGQELPLLVLKLSPPTVWSLKIISPNNYYKMLKDYFKLALITLSHRRLRSWLTMIGIFIGISSVVSLISLGEGFKQAVNKEFENLGTDKLFITPKSGFGTGLNAVNKLTKDELKLIKKISGVENSAGIVLANSKVEFEDNVGFFLIHSFPDGEEKKLEEETHGLKIIEGRDLRDNDKFSALIGNTMIKKELLGKNLRLRDKIKINGYEFTVVGILDKTGDPVGDKTIYIPEDTLRKIFNEPEKLDTIIVKVENIANINIITERIKSELRRVRELKRDEEDFDIQTPEDILGSFRLILNIVQSVLIGIAGISLLVGGVGIANTMYTAVIERRKEIGIMKSLGATNTDILAIFLFESGMLGAIGGAIGAILGFGLSKGIEFIAKNFLGTNLVSAYFSYSLFFGAILFAFFIGAFFGVLPAKQASSLKPVDALRY
jgi:putative ABC transport system permease protein